MSDGIRVETVHNTPTDGPKTLRIEATERAQPRRSSVSRPMVFGMRKSTTAMLAIVMALVFVLQVLQLGQGLEGNARMVTIAVAAGSGVLALLYFVLSITKTDLRDDD